MAFHHLSFLSWVWCFRFCFSFFITIIDTSCSMSGYFFMLFIIGCGPGVDVFRLFYRLWAWRFRISSYSLSFNRLWRHPSLVGFQYLLGLPVVFLINIILPTKYSRLFFFHVHVLSPSLHSVKVNLHTSCGYYYKVSFYMS